MTILFCLFWGLVVLACGYFTLMGAVLLGAGLIFKDLETGIIGLIIFAVASICLGRTIDVAPFTVDVNTHVYQEHK